MRRHPRLWLSSLLLAAAPGAAWAEPLPGFYAAGFLGAQLPEDAETDDGGDFVRELDYDLGLGGGLSAGYDFGYFRLEGEVSLRGLDADALGDGDVRRDAEAEVTTTAFMLNALGDLPLPFVGNRLGLYGGVGVGVARLEFESGPVDDEDAVLAGQVLAGVSVELTRNLTLTAGYRGFTTSEASFEDNGGDLDLDNGITHSGELGLRFTF